VSYRVSGRLRREMEFRNGGEKTAAWTLRRCYIVLVLIRSVSSNEATDAALARDAPNGIYNTRTVQLPLRIVRISCPTRQNRRIAKTDDIQASCQLDPAQS
jgi:hypothetical protein